MTVHMDGSQIDNIISYSLGRQKLLHSTWNIYSKRCHFQSIKNTVI